MQEYTYEKFVEELNGGKFDTVRFRLEGYGHYSNCVIKCRAEQGAAVLVEFLLTADGKERVTYYKGFRDNKIFRFGRGRKSTLRDVWKLVRIEEIVPHA